MSFPFFRDLTLRFLGVGFFSRHLSKGQSGLFSRALSVVFPMPVRRAQPEMLSVIPL
jgi:hypothetical protein